MSGVSISGGNLDLEAILIGGDGFAERLKTFKAAAQEATAAKADAAAILAQARAEADAMLQEATSIKAATDKALADNQAAAEELVKAQAEAGDAKAKFDKKYEEILAIARGDA